MDIPYYLNKFEKAAGKLDKKLFISKQIEIKTGVWLDSVALKLQKKTWANSPHELFQPGPSIFFSTWINDMGIKDEQIYYNIHAFKLRHLKNYSIASREFAADFREKFKKFEPQWPNVSTKFGPLTLMQGWIKLNDGSLSKEVAELGNKFLKIEYLIDDVLSDYKIISG